jgi:hypothetical protein
MGKSSQKAPAAPDPAKVIPLQVQADKDTFDYALQQQRANSITPYGQQSWTQTPSAGTFNESGYNAAMAKYNADLAAQQAAAATKPQKARLQFGGGNGLGGAVAGLNVGSNSKKGKTPALVAPTREQFTTGGGVPQWTYKEELSPQQQKIFDADMASKLGQSALLQQGTDRVAEALKNPYTGEADQLGVAEYLKGLAADSLNPQFNRDVGDAVYSQQTRYLDQQNSQEKQALEARLAEQGFVPGTPGYAQAMGNFQDTTNRAYGGARDAAILQGYGQGNQNIAQRQGIAGLLGNSNAQMISQQLALRNLPLNELNALRTGTQIQAPNAQAQYQTPQMANTDVMGAYDRQYQGQLANYNAQQASNNSMIGALGGIAGAAIGGPFGGALGSSLFSGLGGSTRSYAPTGGSGIRF